MKAKPEWPTYLGEDGTEQFEVKTWVNGEQIGNGKKVHDPFIRTTVKLRGWKYAWNALFGGIVVQIHLDGSQGASRAIMMLDPRFLEIETNKILDERRQSREAHARGDYNEGIACSMEKGR